MQLQDASLCKEKGDQVIDDEKSKTNTKADTITKTKTNTKADMHVNPLLGYAYSK